MNITKHIPNILTCLNIVSGCIAVVAALLYGSLEMAACWIIIGAVFDFSDGFAARMLKAYSPIGKDLDSLADVVTFGVAPGVIVFRLLFEITYVGVPGLASNSYQYLPYVAFVIPVFSALRLAKFNIDDRQTTSFIGLPVPAHALFWASIMRVSAYCGKLWSCNSHWSDSPVYYNISATCVGDPDVLAQD